MQDNAPNSTVQGILQSESHINPEMNPAKKSKVLIYLVLIVILLIIFGLALVISYFKTKQLETENYNATVQRLKERSETPLKNIPSSQPVSSPIPVESQFDLIPTPVISDSKAASTSGVMVVSTGTADLLITNRFGKQIGFKDSKVIQQTSGEHISVPLTTTNKKTGPPPSYTLPADLYTILVEGNNPENINVDVFGAGTLLQVASLPVTKGSRDLITVDGNNRAFSIKTDSTKKMFNASLMIEETKEMTKVFTLTGLTIRQGEEEKFGMSQDDNSLEIINNAQKQSFQLTLEEASANGDIKKSFPVTVTANDNSIITPTNWNDLSNTQITLRENR